MQKIESALISVYNKEGLENIVKKLVDNNVVIYSTGGTYKFIKDLGHPVTSIESITEFPEILDGRVKSLHPKIFGGILNRRDSKKDQKEIKKLSIPKIDLVIVDLYPFEETIENEESSHDDIIEKIDIGGVSLIRAAAKNYKDVLIISSTIQYEYLEKIIDDGLTTSEEERKEFSIDSFNRTSNYDAEIFNWMLNDGSDEDLTLDLDPLKDQNSSFNLDISNDDMESNDYLVCWREFNDRPNRILIHNTYSLKLVNNQFEDLIKNSNIFTEVSSYDEELLINDKMFVKLDEACYMSYVVVDRTSESSFIDNVTFFYKSGFDKVQEYIDMLNECVLDFSHEDSHKLNTMAINQGVLEIEPIINSIDLENIDLYYNSETFKSVEKLVKQIKKSDKGLSIFWGDRGCGKTSIINYISSKLDRIIIFIPNNMIEHTINNPEFRKFLKKYDKPILVLDDCETTFSELYSRTNPLTVNLLQMVDGFLADSINCNIITLFNTTDEDTIDEYLLEANNLIDIIEFKMLNKDESVELSKHLNYGKKIKSDSKLIDIIKKRNSKESLEIGF